jgi:hypothetical protein
MFAKKTENTYSIIDLAKYFIYHNRYSDTKHDRRNKQPKITRI